MLGRAKMLWWRTGLSDGWRRDGMAKRPQEQLTKIFWGTKYRKGGDAVGLTVIRFVALNPVGYWTK